jgi:uncharacterized protein (TIGR00255 family)
MRSMTGFGTAFRDAAGLRAVVEVKSVNYKGLDVKVRLPREAAALEGDIVHHVKARLERGRVEVGVALAAIDAVDVHTEAVQRVVMQARALAAVLDVHTDLSTGDLVRALLSVRGEPPRVDVEVAKPALLGALGGALDGLIDARGAEGTALRAVVLQRLTVLQEHGEQLRLRTALAPARLADKLRARIEAAGLSLDPVRVAQEAALLADRIDVSEELERLEAHVLRARVLAMGTGPAGRQLDFLCQELLREANTLGSKCQDAAAAHLVVELKSEIERLREQVQNIE